MEVTDYDKRSSIYNMESMEQRALKNVNNCLDTNIYSYLETSRFQSYNLYLHVGQFFSSSVN